MLIFRSLVTRFIFLCLVIFLSVIFFTAISFYFTGHIDDNARRINLAGKERMLSFEMGWLLNRAASKDTEVREEILNHVKTGIIPNFEEILHALKEGSDKYSIGSLEDKELTSHIDEINNIWVSRIRPLLLDAIEEIHSGRDGKESLERYNAVIHAFVGEIDAFVSHLVSDNDRGIRAYRDGRIFVIFLAFIVSAILIFYIRKTILIPILHLTRAAGEIEKGNFDATVEIRTEDEIGILSNRFNEMAVALKDTLNKMSRLVMKQKTLFEFSKAIISELDIKLLLNETVERARNLIGARYAAMGVLNDRGDYEYFIPAGLSREVYDELKKRHTLPHNRGLLGYLLEEGRSLRVDDISKHPASVGFPDGHPQMKTFLGVPVKIQKRVIGRLYFTDRLDGGPFTAEDEEVAISFASTAAIAIYNARLLKQLKRYSEELTALNEASRTLIDVKTGKDVYQSICETVQGIFGLRMVWIGHIEKGNYEVTPVSVSGDEDGYLRDVVIRWDDSPEGRGPTGRAIKGMSPVVMNDIESNPYFEPWRRKALARGYRSSMAVPLICARDKFQGILNLYSGEKGYFTEDRVRIIQAFANQAATAIENVRLVEGLEEKVRERTKEAEDARMMAEAANRSKSEFLANMSHELRTPLNALLGFSEIMLRGMTGELTEKQREYLQDIYDSGSHLFSLINDILDLSKIEAGRMELEHEDVDVRNAVEQSLFFVREKAMKHSIRIDVVIEEGIRSVEADKMRLKQVLVNLLSNAAKFTPDGGSIVVSAKEVTDAGVRCIKFSVQDTGPGISERDKSKLFEPFQQLESIYEKKHEGTGLGLALCRRIVKGHGGRIWVESEVGKGSTFSFTIPLEKTAPAGVDAIAGLVVHPESGLLSWESVLRHIDRILSFHSRMGLKFGILRMRIRNLTSAGDLKKFAEFASKIRRKHEIVGHNRETNHFYFILLNSDRQETGKAQSRLRDILAAEGYDVTVDKVLFPDDGKSREEILKALEKGGE